jgi:hypothetical protein
VPAYVDGTKRPDVRFRGDFALSPASARGNLIFRADVAAGNEPPRWGEFQYIRTANRGQVETRTLPGVGIQGARELAVETFGDTLSGQTVRGFTVSATQDREGRWEIVRFRLGPDGKTSLPERVAKEGERLPDGMLVSTLNVAPLLEFKSRPRPDGPAFTINEAGDVAFLASDGTFWGLYRTLGSAPVVGTALQAELRVDRGCGARYLFGSPIIITFRTSRDAVVTLRIRYEDGTEEILRANEPVRAGETKTIRSVVAGLAGVRYLTLEAVSGSLRARADCFFTASD